MKNLLVSFFALILTGCGLTERITQNRTVKVDTVYKDISIPEHNFTDVFELQDSLFFEDDRLALSLARVKANPPKGNSADSAHEQKEIAAQKPNLWRIDATVKPETVRVDVPQKTITETKETTRYIKRTPSFVKYVLGGLVMMILIMVVAWKIRQ